MGTVNAFPLTTVPWPVDEVRLTGAGIDETGTTDSTVAIQAIVNAATKPVAGVPGATYKVSSITLKDGSDMRGNGATLVSTAISGRGVFEATAKTNLAVSGWTASGNLGAALLRTVACSQVDVVDNVCTNLSFLVTNSANGNVYAGSAETENNDILVDNNTGTATGAAVGGIACVLLLYASDVIVSGNRMTGYPQGVQYWGGDANPVVNGALANARKCKRVWIDNNRVYGTPEGGLWGSMGEHIWVTDNFVESCADVGIDFEGSFDCLARGNTAKGCTNANYATFSLCKGIRFESNLSIGAAGSTANLLVIHNSTQDASRATGNQDITVVDNDFRCTSGVGAPLGFEVAHDIVFRGNRCHNTSTFFASVNSHNVAVLDNDYTWSVAASAAIRAVEVGSNVQTDGGIAPTIEVRDNRIRAAVAQPAGSVAIHSTQADVNSSPLLMITGNEVYGFPTDIVSQWGGTNAATTLQGEIARNTLATLITVTNTGAATPQAVERHSNRNYAGAAFAPSRTVTGSRGGNAALASVLTQLQALGLIVDGSS